MFYFQNALKASLSFMMEGVQMLHNPKSQEFYKIICEMKLWDTSSKSMREAVEGKEKEISELEVSPFSDGEKVLDILPLYYGFVVVTERNSSNCLDIRIYIGSNGICKHL